MNIDDDAPPPVDFDALHAALGDPLDYQDMPSGPAVEGGQHEPEDLLDGLEPAVDAGGNGAPIGESSGRTNATYASARPRTIPPTRAPVEDPNAPAVIVASDTDTVPTAPPQMTVPLGAVPGQHVPPPFAGAPRGAPHGGPPGSNPHIGASPSGRHGVPGHPSSGAHPAAAVAAYPTPQAFPVQARGIAQMTMRMPDRPINPRRGKTATVVVRPRGPSARQRLIAFMAMLLLVTACGIAVIIWRKPRWLGLEPGTGGPATTSAPAAPVGTLGASSAAVVATATGPTLTPVSPIVAPVAPVVAPAASGSATPAASASAAPKKILKPVPPAAPHPAPSIIAPVGR